ncbi:MAG: aminodeoxychorismate/anthranilate synthase component II [Planctomycetota bacterium]|nr:MAG: aminodeoxychorismate/anthranilate synthase component II [Planctomycetota bacterium]REJ93978.1 MAG: aminodeoxychorismate/anthranilate synthase component II [Planctomycetota bacterium]REK30958.1 MAG: aminodeoxychorismate/anthranilate synthase component II [Planctomycetota bacterium]REK38210.1 MAG: aminodeoxychorismate/anthranilate synthase component II [Planctomycetota bacterium]
MILLIDNYDSFVHNLARHFRRLGQTTHVVRNDAVTVAEIERETPAAIVISPGPCTPREAGCSVEVVRHFAARVPMLGVCLGHQAIAAALGAEIVRAPRPMHGRTSPIDHDGRGVFVEVPSPLEVCRYHSLVVDEGTLPAELEVTARDREGVVMALQHREWPLVGLQFHPEAILTASGYRLLANFLRMAGVEVPVDLPPEEYQRPEPMAVGDVPGTGVTF